MSCLFSFLRRGSRGGFEGRFGCRLFFLKVVINSRRVLELNLLGFMVNLRSFSFRMVALTFFSFSLSFRFFIFVVKSFSLVIVKVYSGKFLVIFRILFR